MNKFKFLILLVGLFNFYVFAAGKEVGTDGQEVGNGGGGVVTNSKYMSFYSAGLYVKLNNQNEMTFQLPALDDLISYIANLETIDLKTKGVFIETMIPSSKRKYLFAEPEQLTPKIYERLMEEFRRVTGVDSTQLKLFAITDTVQKFTYLLPDFNKLSRNDQMALLFHEAYWIVNPSASYNDVIGAEMAFQAAYTNPNDVVAMYDFLEKVKVSKVNLAVALAKWDLEEGNIDGFLDDNMTFPLKKIYGDDFIKCVLPLVVNWSTDNTHVCNFHLAKNLYKLTHQYPKSMIFKKMLDIFSTQGDVLIGYKGKTGTGAAPNGDGVVEFRRAFNGHSRQEVKKLMNCPVHLLKNDKNDCGVGDFFRGGYLMLNI